MTKPNPLCQSFPKILASTEYVDGKLTACVVYNCKKNLQSSILTLYFDNAELTWVKSNFTNDLDLEYDVPPVVSRLPISKISSSPVFNVLATSNIDVSWDGYNSLNVFYFSIKFDMLH